MLWPVVKATGELRRACSAVTQHIIHTDRGKQVKLGKNSLGLCDPMVL